MIEREAFEATHPLLAKDMRERYELSAAAQLVPTDEIVMTKAELKEYTDHIAELERALAGGDFPDDCSSCPNNPTNYPPSGFKLVAVKGFDDLVSALERASRKGYMPDAMVDEWEAFEIAIGHAAADHAAQPEQPAKLTDEQIVAIRDEHLPSQGDPFDCIAFARAIERALEGK